MNKAGQIARSVKGVQSAQNDLIVKKANVGCHRQETLKENEKNMKLTKSGLGLKEVIEKAIKDHVITNSEYEEIMKVASNDGIADDHEQRLLSQLQRLLENGTLKRTTG